MTTRTFKAKNGLDVIGNITVSGTVDGRDLATDGTKLDNVASGADATPAWVPSSDPGYVSTSGATFTGDIKLNDNVDIWLGTGNDLQMYHNGNTYFSNVRGTLHFDQLADNTAMSFRNDNGSGGITTYIQLNGATGEVDLRHYGSSKLTTSSTGISVTGSIDATGGLQLDSHLGISTGDITLSSGNIIVSGTVDGRDVATDGTKLDGIAAGADVTPSWVPSSDPSYLTSAASAWPVGSIFMSTVSTNPATLLGFGTWVEFGAGRVPVGQNTGDASFDVLEETGGSKNATLVSHTHTTADSRLSASNAINWVLGGVGSVTVNRSGTTPYMNVGDPPPGSYRTQMRFTTQEDTITSSTAGSSGTNANLQPYIVVKMWKRTA
jgi:hypothetical protein